MLSGTSNNIGTRKIQKKVDCLCYIGSQLSLLLLVFISISLLSITKTYASGINNAYVVPNEQLQQLANHQQWQHLLFYKNGKAEVISNNFYLSLDDITQKQDFTPYQELIATLEHANEQATVCKYPARYYWLAHQLPQLNINLTHCPNLPNPEQNISLILVSNYLKNPASTFGHVLIKTNSTPPQESTNGDKYATNNSVVYSASSQDLLNQSYNFGASVPANDSSIVYAIKGLFGFYDAGFSKADFFKQDAVYSKNEQRDMWEFVLNLDEFDTALLNYHLYEAQSARFNYYFIKQNCGYRSGEILELIKDDINTTNRIGGWYAPDFVFDQLVEYQQEGQNSPLIKQTRYLPSEQTQLRQKFVQLSDTLQSTINHFITNEDITVLDTLNLKEQTLALDFLVTHRSYKISQESDSQQKNHHEMIKKQLISKRINLPSDNSFAQLPLTFKPSPALSNKTTRTGISVSENHMTTDLTLFVKDPLNTYTDINKRFEAIKLAATYDFNKQDIEFDEFVFLEMQQIEDLSQPLASEAKLSWQLKTGITDDPIQEINKMTYITAGMGVGIDFSDQLTDNTAIGYALVNSHLHDQKSHIDISTQLGLRLKDEENKRAGELQYTIRKRYDSTLVQNTSLSLRQELNKNNDAKLTLSYTDNSNLTNSNNNGFDAKLTLNHYW